jgi:hypothetical protein
MGGAVVAVAVGLAGCAAGGGGDAQVATAKTGAVTASGSPSASAGDDADAGLKFAQCMRSHGLSWFPDPKADGSMDVRIPAGTDERKFQAAQDACKGYAQGGSGTHSMSPEDFEKMRELSQCMRDHGVTKFPDPKPGEGLRIDANKVGMGPGNPTFDAAQKACEKYQPPGARTQTHSDGGGNGDGSGGSLHIEPGGGA